MLNSAGNENLSIRKIILLTLCSTLSAWFIYKTIGNSIEEFFPLYIISFAQMYLYAIYRCLDKKWYAYFSILSLLCSFSIVMGLSIWNNIDITNRKIVVLSGIFAFLPVMAGIDSLLSLIENNAIKASTKRFPNTLFIMIIIFLLWVPIFCLEYPGILISDSTWQFAQANGSGLSNHHPVAHTFLIYIAQNVSKILGGGSELNPTVAVAVYSLMQMIIMSSIFAYSVSYLKKRNIRNSFLTLILIFYAVFPMNSLFSIYMTKDVIFSGLILLLTIECIEIIRTKEESLKSPIGTAAFILTLLGVMVMRSNGIIIVIGTLFVYLFVTNNKRKAILFLVTIIITYICYGRILALANVQQPSIAEALGTPINQIAEVVVNDRELAKDEKDLINEVIPIEKIKSVYNPYYSDPIKFDNDFNATAISENLKSYLALWFNIFNKYPGDCIDSSLHLTIGYWYPAVQKGSFSFNLSQQKELMQQIGADKKVNLTLDRYIGSEVRNNIFESWLWSIGLEAIFLLIIITYLLSRNRYIWIFPFVPCLFGWISLMMFTPSYCETRYAYYLFISLPILALVPSIAKEAPMEATR